MTARGSGLFLFLSAVLGCDGPDRPTNLTAATKLWSGTDLDFITGDISPDGRYLSDIDWASGDLRLFDLRSGQARALTGRGYDAGGYAWTSAFSGDGRRIAVAWYLDSVNSHELRVVDLEGTDVRVVVPAREDRYYVDPVDWSASGEEILVAVQIADRTWQLGLVAVDDGTMRIVKTFGWQTPGGGHDQAYPDADLSPDGRYVAYDYPPTPDDPTRDIYTVAVEGGRETVLVAGPGSDRLLGWLPAGGGILFYSDRSGSPAVWRLEVRNGRPVGEPAVVHREIRGLVPLAFTLAGFAYGIPTDAGQVHTAAVDPAAGAVLEAPRPVPNPPWRRSFAADWSPDGKSLAYINHDPLPDPVEHLVLTSLSGEVTRTYPLSPALHSSNGTLRWVAEDRLFLFAYQQGRDGIYQVDLGTGAFRRLPTPTSIGRRAIKWFDVAPDGRSLYMIGPPTAAGREDDLVAFDVVTGEHKVIGTSRAIPASLSVSPDGKELAFLSRDDASRQVELRVVPTGGGGPGRTIHRAPRGTMGPPITWTPDGSRVLFESQGNDGRSGLWSVAARGGEAVRVLPDCCRENDVRIHRDGRRIAYAAGTDRGEVWVLQVP